MSSVCQVQTVTYFIPEYDGYTESALLDIRRLSVFCTPNIYGFNFDVFVKVSVKDCDMSFLLLSKSLKLSFNTIIVIFPNTTVIMTLNLHYYTTSLDVLYLQNSWIYCWCFCHVLSFVVNIYKISFSYHHYHKKKSRLLWNSEISRLHVSNVSASSFWYLLVFVVDGICSLLIFGLHVVPTIMLFVHAFLFYECSCMYFFVFLSRSV